MLNQPRFPSPNTRKCISNDGATRFPVSRLHSVGYPGAVRSPEHLSIDVVRAEPARLPNCPSQIAILIVYGGRRPRISNELCAAQSVPSRSPAVGLTVDLSPRRPVAPPANFLPAFYHPLRPFSRRPVCNLFRQ